MAGNSVRSSASKSATDASVAPSGLSLLTPTRLIRKRGHWSLDYLTPREIEQLWRNRSRRVAVRVGSAVKGPGQELVPELPARIMLLKQVLEIAQPRIAGSQLRGSQGEQLPPVGTDFVRGQLLL